MSEPDAAEERRYHLHRRFDRMGRLVGDDGMGRLFASHVMVVGLGGVGSFAVEALARSGVGRLTLVDFDRVCVTNTNRQLQALSHAVGQSKAEVLAQRVNEINPQVVVEPVHAFFASATADKLLARSPDYVIDAIDNVTAKCHLLATCRTRGMAVVSATGAAGRMDMGAIRTGDLAETTIDPLAAAVRKILRTQHDFPRQGTFGIRAVYSVEAPRTPIELHYDRGHGFRCVCPGGKNTHHSCEERNVIYGTACFVTGAFGLACAGEVVRALTDGPKCSP